MAALLNINLFQGETFTRKFTYKDSGNTPFDLTGWTGVGQLRKSPGDSKAYNFNITFNNPRTDGVFYVTMPYSNTFEIAIESKDPTVPDQMVYDVFLTHADGSREKILYGTASVYPSATRV